MGLGQGGFGQTGAGAGSQVIQMPRQIAYTAVLRFPTQPISPTRMQADVRAVLDRSASLSNARGVDVLTDGQVVVLRGAVRDEDEAILVEGMIRLTPGVRDVRNELKFPGKPEPRP
jgi:hypothetical protein